LSNGTVSSNKITFAGLNETVNEGNLSISLFANVDSDTPSASATAISGAKADVAVTQAGVDSALSGIINDSAVKGASNS
jgi:hypothetical protein